MLRLRTSDGICRADYQRRFGDFTPVEQVLRPLERCGLAACTVDGCHLTEQGFLVSNAIISQLDLEPVP